VSSREEGTALSSGVGHDFGATPLETN